MRCTRCSSATSIRLDDLEVICAVLECGPEELPVSEPGTVHRRAQSVVEEPAQPAVPPRPAAPTRRAVPATAMRPERIVQLQRLRCNRCGQRSPKTPQHAQCWQCLHGTEPPPCKGCGGPYWMSG